MSHESITLMQGDSYPEPNLTLKDKNTGDRSDPESWLPIDLSAATTSVRVDFRRVGETDIVTSVVCTKYGDGTDGKVFFRIPAIVTDEVGTFNGEIVINRNGDTETVLTRLKVTIKSR